MGAVASVCGGAAAPTAFIVRHGQAQERNRRPAKRVSIVRVMASPECGDVCGGGLDVCASFNLVCLKFRLLAVHVAEI